MINKGMMSSNKSDWETPQDFFDKLNWGIQFTLDVCATKDNTKCERFYSPEIDGLKQSWKGEKCWMNPPYGREIGKWVKKASDECYVNGVLTVALLPARTDTKWFHEYINNNSLAEIRFIKGRLKFINRSLPSWREDGKLKVSSAPFPSMIVIWR